MHADVYLTGGSVEEPVSRQPSRWHASYATVHDVTAADAEWCWNPPSRHCWRPA